MSPHVLGTTHQDLLVLIKTLTIPGAFQVLALIWFPDEWFTLKDPDPEGVKHPGVAKTVQVGMKSGTIHPLV